MKTTDSKEKRIRTCLLAGNTLTKVEALKFFRHLNLGDVVFKMRKEGHDVEKVMRTNPKTKARYAEYFVREAMKKRIIIS